MRSPRQNCRIHAQISSRVYLILHAMRTLGTILNGKTRTFDLPATLVARLAAGPYKGIVLRADNTSVLSGKPYSSNYAQFDGTDGDTVPKLTVTYTV